MASYHVVGDTVIHVECKISDERDASLGIITVLFCYHTAIPPGRHMSFGFAYEDAPSYYRRAPILPWRLWNRNFAQ
jgi:hypothetical protein